MATEIIESVEFTTLASNWTEHLCLHRRADGSFRIDVMGWEVWGEESEFWNEDTEECEVPDEIDGHTVVGVEDGLVVIDRLVPTGNSDSAYDFKEFDWEDYLSTFSEEAPAFKTEDVKGKILEAISSLTRNN